MDYYLLPLYPFPNGISASESHIWKRARLRRKNNFSGKQTIVICTPLCELSKGNWKITWRGEHCRPAMKDQRDRTLLKLWHGQQAEWPLSPLCHSKVGTLSGSSQRLEEHDSHQYCAYISDSCEFAGMRRETDRTKHISSLQDAAKATDIQWSISMKSVFLHNVVKCAYNFGT